MSGSPNPSAWPVQLQFASALAGWATFELFTTDWRKVHRQLLPLARGGNTFDLEPDLPSDIYLLPSRCPMVRSTARSGCGGECPFCFAKPGLAPKHDSLIAWVRDLGSKLRGTRAAVGTNT